MDEQTPQQVKVASTTLPRSPHEADIWLTLETPIDGKPCMIAAVNVVLPDPSVAPFVADMVAQAIRRVFAAPENADGR